MATANLLPTSETRSYNGWTSYGAWPADIQSNNGDGSFEYVDRAVGGYESAQVDNMPANTGPILSVVTHSFMRRSGTGTNGYFREGCRYGSSNSLGPNNGLTDAYVDINHSHATAPGGGGWSKTVLNSTQVLFYHDGTGSGNTVRVTYAYIYVSYTPTGLMASIFGLLPLIGVMSELAHFVKLENFLRALEVGHWRSRITLDRFDMEILKASLRGIQRSYVCL